MQRILDLIEATLDAEVTPAELAEMSGYSLWHFLHLFTREVGMPLERYRTRRRLAHAIWHISRGMGVTDAALRWGFGTHSGFYRAFQKEYGTSPTQWLRTHRVPAPVVPLIKEEVFRMLNREKFRETLSHWGDAYAALPLTPVTYPGGQISESCVYVGENLMLKAYRDARTCRLALALAQALHDRGIPAGLAVPMPDGETTLPIGDGLFLCLCHRVPGTPLRAEDLIRDPLQGRRIGEALARLHRATAVLADDADVDAEPYADHVRTWALPRVQDILPSAFPADYEARLDALNALPEALVHRDPNPSNLIDTGRAIGFVDFDLSRRFVRIFDPCYTITAVLSETFGREELPWRENWPDFSRAVLAGYDQVSPLTETERAAVPTLILGNELLALAAFAGSSKYQDVFDVNRRMLPYILDNMPV